MYTLGLGVLKNDVYADMWWSIAGSNGDENALKNRDMVVGMMTPSQLKKHKTLPVNVSVRDTRIVE